MHRVKVPYLRSCYESVAELGVDAGSNPYVAMDILIQAMMFSLCVIQNSKLGVGFLRRKLNKDF